MDTKLYKFPAAIPLAFLRSLILLSFTATLAPNLAQADDFDREGVRGDTYCFPAKYIVKTLSELEEIKPSQKDVVEINMQPQFLIYDDGALPDRFFLKSKSSETDFTIETDGKVSDFLKKVQPAKKSDDACITDPARAGLNADDESLYFEMGLTPYFKNTSGTHSLVELKKGTKDGKSQYKKLIPSVARMFMPDTDHLHIKYADSAVKPEVFARVNGKDIALETEFYNEGYVIDCETLEEMNAEALIVRGGTYKLSPISSIKMMKKYGIGKPRGPKAKIQEAL